MNNNGFSEFEDIFNELKNKKIEFYAESNRIVNKNKTVKNQRVYWVISL